MLSKKCGALLLLFALFVLSAKPVGSTRHVTIEFIYWYPIDSPCLPCVQEVIDDYYAKNFSLGRIQSNYGSGVTVNRVEYYSDQGTALRQSYGVTVPNSLVIKSDDGHYTKLEAPYNETYEDILRQTVDMYLIESPAENKGILECNARADSEVIAASIYIVENGYHNQTPFADYFDPGDYTINATWKNVFQSQTITITNGTKTSITLLFNETIQGNDRLIVALAAAFTVGFFETFSPCLIALLSFVLSYSIGGANQFRTSMLKTLFFASGFLIAAVLLAVATLLTLFSVVQFYDVMTWAVCFIALFFGLNLLGLDFKRLLKINVNPKPIVGSLTRRFALTSAGLVLLGFLFYFIDPCLAPLLVVAHITKFPEHALSSLLVFAFGVLVPFFAMGLLAGSISKLVRSTYKHKAAIRAISGIILIGYSVWLVYELSLFA